MAWNDPKNQNGQGGKDPWGRRDQDGPPDLEEVFRQWQSRLRGLLGGKGGSSGASSGPPTPGPLGRVGFGVAAIIFVSIYALMGIFVVEPAEEAVVTRFGKYNRTVDAGPHWLAPMIESKRIVNVQRVETSKHSGLMLTEDKNIVSVDIAAQYRVSDPKEFLFSVRDPIRSLQQMTDSALRTVVGQSVMDEVLASGRSIISEEIKQQIQNRMNLYGTGIEVVDLAMLSSKPPEQVKPAFDDAIKAGQDQQRLVNEAEAYANKIVPVAEGKAKRVIEEANAYQQQVILDARGQTVRFDALLPEYKRAPQLMRDRLYLDAMQQVYGNSNKVLIDVEGGNSLFYLPLDKITQSKVATKVEDPDDTDTAYSDVQNQVMNTPQSSQATTARSSRTSYRDVVRSGRSGG